MKKLSSMPGKSFRFVSTLLGVFSLGMSALQAEDAVLESLDVTVGTVEIAEPTTLSGPATTSDPVVVITGGAELEVTAAGEMNVQKGQTRVGYGSGETGTLTVSGGTAVFGTLTSESGDFARVVVGGDSGMGTLDLESGTVQIGNTGTGSSSANYGSLRIGLGTGSTGVFNQTGGLFDAESSGSMSIGQDGGTGTYNLSSGSAVLGGLKKFHLHVGRNDSLGNFNISGNSTVQMGSASPEDASADGYAFFHIGNYGTDPVGHVTQTGTSTFTTERTLIYVGNIAGGTGTYTIGDTAELITLSSHPSSTGDRIRLGSEDGGVGTFTQNDSSLVDLQNGGKINIMGSTSAYNLNGGTLQVGGVNGIRGEDGLNLGGGTIKVIESDLTSSVTPTLMSGTTSTFDTNGLNAAFENGFSGTGAFTKIGAGDLSVGGSTTLSGTSSIEAGNFVIGNAASGAGNLTLATGNTLNVNSLGSGFTRLVVGDAATGVMNIDGGSVDLQYQNGNGATFRVGESGGNGTVNMSDGLVTISEGSSGSYGVIVVGQDDSSVGVFNQSGGTINENGVANLQVGMWGATGTYTLSNDAVFTMNGSGSTTYFGHLAAGNSTVNFLDNSTFTQTADVQNFIALDGGTAVFNQDGAGTNVTWYGDTGTGVRPFYVGNGTGSEGTYNLRAGNLTFDTMNVRFGADDGSEGVLNQTGGTLQVTDSSFFVGHGGSGTYGMSGGEATFGQGMTLASGATSSGQMLHTAGTVSIGSGGKISFGSGTGSYELDGGTLEVGGSNGIQSGSGSATFQLGGGTLKVIDSDLSTSTDLSTVAATTSVIDTNGLNATFDGAFGGTGLVQKSGSGTMTVNSASSTADFEVSSGTLEGLGATTGSIAVSAGALLSGGISAGGITTIQSGGAHAPGFSPGAVYSAGSYLLADGATLYLELGGITGGTGTFSSPSTGDFDQLLYDGGITIEDNANLVISSYDTYIPEIGDRFNILLSDEVISLGSGVNVTGSGLLSGYSFSLLGASSQSFGSTSGLNAVQLIVIPEPATWVLAMLMTATGLVVFRRRLLPLRNPVAK